MKHLMLKAMAASVLLGLAVGPALATGNGQVSSEFNPYAPSFGHTYRHGAVPTREVHQKIKNYRATHASTAATSANTLAYGGGIDGVGVMDGHVKVYIVYYGSQWGTQSTNAKGDDVFSGDSYGAAAVAEEMFKGIGTGNELWSADLTQWCDGPNVATGATSCPSNASFVPYQTGGVLAGVYYDNSAAAPSAPTATDLANEAIKAAAHFGNTAAGSNRYTYYIVMSPHGTDPDNYQSPTQGYCAWHNYTTSSYGDIAYSNQPYNMDMGSSCGVNFVNSGSAGSLDGWTMTLGHEWHEMMSDTYPAGGWSNASSGEENSDECAWIAAGQAGGAANVTMGTAGTFTEQASWSNDTNACAISHAILHGGSTGGTPVANFTDTVSGLTVNFTDSSTDTGGTISSHSWTFGDGATSTTASPSHTYAAAGTYSVTETVTDSTGATSSKTASVTVSSGSTGKPVANFTDTVSGLTASFTDSSTDTGGTISSYAWTFGDNSTATTASPSHTYAAAGTYSVTETVKDNTGATSSKTASVTVTAPSGGTFSNNTKKTIADNATITSSIAVTGEPGAAPAALSVHVNITHNWSGDLEIDLVAPNGAYAVLQSPDYNDDGNINATYTVNASSVQGNGTWKLRVIDNDPWYSGDYGTLNGWSMTF
ncbi:PKD domain-containing protein [Dyella agri]|uniref:PKD domain-containing protein n=1 Tax=Dyella agri TaxID=1926869 RepID=A0ABW8KEK0_9GAMM